MVDGQTARDVEVDTGHVTWRQLAGYAPEFVQWVVQTHGPRPTEEVSRDEYERLVTEYREAMGWGS